MAEEADIIEERPNVDSANHKPAHNEFLIAGLGASAGGIPAFQEFFQHLPSKSGIAYVVILHLSPDHDSSLAKILQITTKMPVAQVTERVLLQPDHVYVVPPNQHLTMEDGSVVVTPNTNIEDRRAPVDIFFRTLAEEHGSRAVAIILSGTGANGSMGLKRVKEKGGAVFVQNPREAEFNEMPRNAIATGLVDEVLNVADIPAKIITYKNSLGKIQISEDADKRPQDQQQALREIFTNLRVHTGHDFSNYKRPTLLRRIERRINIHNLPDLPSYVLYIRQNPEEITTLLKDLLISVTNFFRDKKAFEIIETEILPLLLKGKTAENQLRIWVAGCATGEEAYSLAMLCAEKTSGNIDAPKVQIFATDIDEASIATAREGLYNINDLADISSERLRRFFVKEGDEFRIRREVRETIMFANHNFLQDPPFSHLDLISCRNVMIYLNHVAQERVTETFHFALNPAGFLFLGSSESVDGATDLFAVYNKENHIFQSRLATSRTYPIPESVPKFQVDKQRLTILQENESKMAERISFGNLHQQLLEQYAPPSLIVNEEYNIVHLSERVGRFLQIGGGEPSQNLLNLIHPELRLELRSALYQATQRQMAVEARGLKLTIDDHTEIINIHVRPVLRAGDTARGFILILFETSTATDAPDEVLLASNEPVAQHLEEELMRLKAQLRSSNEQHEFQAEELKASNEELQAMNEELRSAAEELETSKEELQSINEELRTVNQELKVKIEETSLTSDNFENLINSTNIGTIFLDRSFRIALFTPAAKAIFNLIPADYGRPLSDITNHLAYGNLLNDVERVLNKLITLEQELSTEQGKVFLMSISPYRTKEDRINGVVITFVDITARKAAEEALRQSEERLRTLADAVPQVIWANEEEGKANYFNKRWYEYSGLSYQQSAGPGWQAIVHPDDAPASVEKWNKALSLAETFDTEYRLRRYDGTYRWFIGRNFPLKNEAGKVISWFGSATDIEDVKQAQEALSTSQARLRTTMDSATDYSIITMDTERKIQLWSSGAEKVFGYKESEVLGKAGDLIFTPEDRAAGVPGQETETAKKEGNATDERWHVRRDGTKFFMSGIMSPIYDGELTGYVKVARDMTEQRNALEKIRVLEERYRIALLSAEMGTWDWDVERDVTTWNDQHYQLLGLQPDNQPINAAYFLQFIYKDDVENVKTALRKAVEETGVYHAEFRIVRADNGEVHWMNGYGRSYTQKGKHSTRMIGVMYDITERKQLDQQKEDFIGIASHELKTPVTSIKAYAELLEDVLKDNEDRTSKKLIQKLGAQVERMVELIKSLLDTARISKGKLEFNKESFDLHKLITECAEDLQRITPSHQISYTNCEEMNLIADRDRINQVLINLISNAVKYSPKGGEVTIGCQTTNNTVQVSVHDNGIGISKESQQKIFERFYREKTAKTNSYPGLGLGLFITANIVKRHGGNIWVESEPGKGSTFYFTLPKNSTDNEKDNNV